MVNGHSAFGCRVGANTQVHPYPQLNQSIIKQTNISHPEGLHFSLFVSHSSLFVFHFSLFVFHFPCHSERQRRVFFCHFWLDPKVTQRSRLRALHTPSRRLQVGKSGNSLRFGQPDFLSPCSLLRRLTARGPLTNTEAFEARFLTAFGMTKGGIQIHIHSGFQPSAEGVALFPNASLRCTLG